MQCNAMGYTVLQYRDQLQTALAAVVMQWCTSSFSGKYPSRPREKPVSLFSGTEKFSRAMSRCGQEVMVTG